jgi:thioesterase domain-containing protein
MARQLRILDERAALTILLDTTVDERYWPKADWINIMINFATTRIREIAGAPPKEKLRHLKRRLRGLGRRLQHRGGKLPVATLDEATEPLPENLQRVRAAAVRAMAGYYPPYYDGEVVLLRCAVKNPLHFDATRLWQLACRRLIVREVPGEHHTFLEEPHVMTLADCITQTLRSAANGSRKSVETPLLDTP